MEKKLKHKKYQKISILPNILILSIQRYDKIKNIKNECEVIIDENLDINNYTIDIYKDKINYELYGFIVHKGNINLLIFLFEGGILQYFII